MRHIHDGDNDDDDDNDNDDDPKGSKVTRLCDLWSLDHHHDRHRARATACLQCHRTLLTFTKDGVPCRGCWSCALILIIEFCPLFTYLLAKHMDWHGLDMRSVFCRFSFCGVYRIDIAYSMFTVPISYLLFSKTITCLRQDIKQCPMKCE